MQTSGSSPASTSTLFGVSAPSRGQGPEGSAGFLWTIVFTDVNSIDYSLHFVTHGLSISGTFLFTLFTCHDVVPLPLCRATREGSKEVDIPLLLTAYREPQEGVPSRQLGVGSRVAELW